MNSDHEIVFKQLTPDVKEELPETQHLHIQEKERQSHP